MMAAVTQQGRTDSCTIWRLALFSEVQCNSAHGGFQTIQTVFFLSPSEINLDAASGFQTIQTFQTVFFALHRLKRSSSSPAEGQTTAGIPANGPPP